MTNYNGKYIKQTSLTNGKDWWRIRSDQPTPYVDSGATIYWSDSDSRWVIEASDVIWKAPTTVFNTLDDDRQFPGLQEYFGDGTNDWQQVSDTGGGAVSVSIACVDTHFPTEEPTASPTQQPTQQPTTAHCQKLCGALFWRTGEKTHMSLKN